ncbi:MAG: hypothetical protein Q9217_004329 [Psora testacea]
MAPKTTRQWNLTGGEGFDSLKFTEAANIPKLGDHDVLINIHFASLNYRDLIISKGKYHFPTASNVIPASDGSGTVLATGHRVTSLAKGDKVTTLFHQSHQVNPITAADVKTGLGGAIDGTLRQYAVFEEKGLVKMPESLSFKEASTLPCAALTAWNSLYGIESRGLKPGDWVLTQGTGGVSIFALQFAKAAGARVISTTSSDQKAQTLKSLGADHVINYKTDTNWGETAKNLTPGQVGVNHILEVGGPKTMAQSLEAIRPEGVISIIGFLGGMSKKEQPPTFVECLSHMCTVRGVLVGSKQQFEQMNAAIDATGIKPVVHEKVFAFEEVKEAYSYMWEQKHFGKLCIRVDDDSVGGSKL